MTRIPPDLTRSLTRQPAILEVTDTQSASIDPKGEHTMTDEMRPKIENLDQTEQELTAEQAEEAQGGIINSLEFNRPTLQAKPTIEIG